MPDVRRILITGANRGIGLAMVQAALERPHTHVFLGARDAARGEVARQSVLAAQPGWAERLEVLELDVSAPASIRAAAEELGRRHGTKPSPLFGLVNNAGVGGHPDGVAGVVRVNVHGPRQVCEAFIPLLNPDGGRVVNISSAAGPTWVAKLPPEAQRAWIDPEQTWGELDARLAAALATTGGGADIADGGAYGLSKAALNAVTLILARTHPKLQIHACTPGFIETDLTRPYAASAGKTPGELGMKAPAEGTRSTMHLLFETVPGRGHYYGSDAVRSPMDRYRAPGDPPYTGA